MSRILDYLQIKPSSQSIDYINNKKQFHLFTLLTEQRHPKTWNLSSVIRENTGEGLKMLLSVDDDITSRIEELSKDMTLLENAVDAIYRSVKGGKKIYFYGCGATGRLAKQMESTFWRPFWRKIKASDQWAILKDGIPSDIEEHLIGEMTGADRALISSLEGFEDLQLIGRLQLNDRGIQKGDSVFCVTEGGETSSVIGTILAARNQYGDPSPANNEASAGNLYFAYNNPDEKLLPFDRSRTVIENQGITKLNFTTGPQGITGSTRLQATTSETFILGAVLEEAIHRILKDHLDGEALAALGFSEGTGLAERLLSFRKIRESISRSVSDIAKLTDLESETYSGGHFSTYFAGKALVTVFIDSTERSPTFKLFPLDTVNEPLRRSWIQVWTGSNNKKDAWQALLGRDFRGLERSFYEQAFRNEIDDVYLKEVALKSLANAGDEQQELYDFSFSEESIRRCGPGKGDIGVIVCVDEECSGENDSARAVRRFSDLVRLKGGKVAVVSVMEEPKSSERKIIRSDINIEILLPAMSDPIGLRKEMALKMILNAHSTAMMAKLGRVTGNTMTNVNPSNLKLIGRATFLIMSHVNDKVRSLNLNEGEPVTFEDVNAVLYNAIGYVAGKNPGQTAEVALSIIRIIEALKKKKHVGWDEALSILNSRGLNKYLEEI